MLSIHGGKSTPDSVEDSRKHLSEASEGLDYINGTSSGERIVDGPFWAGEHERRIQLLYLPRLHTNYLQVTEYLQEK